MVHNLREDASFAPVLAYLTETRGLAPETLAFFSVGASRSNFPVWTSEVIPADAGADAAPTIAKWAQYACMAFPLSMLELPAPARRRRKAADAEPPSTLRALFTRVKV